MWGWAWWWAWVAVWAWAGKGAGEGSPPTLAAGMRTNVVAEVPGLDVGPLVAVTVALGHTARLPCRYPRLPDDTVSLVLWYLNHTSRPFLSFDARGDMEHGGSLILPGDRESGRGTNRISNSIGRGLGRGMQRKGRVRLERDGTALLLENVTLEDAAEYRCRVHYRLSPTWTQRLLLTVHDSVTGLVLVDGAGHPVTGASVGPFPEGHRLRLACRAQHGGAKVLSLVWLLEGVEVDSSWEVVGAGVVSNVLEMGGGNGLEQGHHNAHLTCRLTTQAHAHVAANLTDVSTTITMFHVPEASITVQGGQVTASEGGYLVTEGSDLTFLCSVTAHPPAYNVTWLHKGRVVSEGGRRWRQENWRLRVSPVRRADAGLYTCLASNSVGDGHSNALLLSVAHPPQCQGPAERQVVAALNASVTLTCKMDSVPAPLDFTWTLAAPPSDPAHQDAHDARGGIITGDAPPPHRPRLIDLTPGQPRGPGEPRGTEWEVPPGAVVLGHRVQSQDPSTSSATLTPTSPAHVFCYARNSVGRTTIPCTYLLTLVDPPEPPRDCNVVVSVNLLEVKCHDLPPMDSDQRQFAQVHHAPGISFVRSSGVKPTTNLEVWSEGTLVANVSDSRPQLTVKDLPPDAPLQLLVYAVTPHARSRPLHLTARTPPRLLLQLTEPSTSVPDPADLFYDEEPLWGGLNGTMGAVVGGLLGGMSVVLLLLTLAVVLIRLKQHHQHQQQQEEGGGGGGAAAAAAALPTTTSSNTVTPPKTIHHDIHSASHSSLDLETRSSVYCVGSGDGRSEAAWLETSITPLVALTTPPTDPQVMSPGLPLESRAGDAV